MSSVVKTPILLVSATTLEVRSLLQSYSHDISPHFVGHITLTPSIHLLITGVGMLACSTVLTQHLVTHAYALAINVGFSGAYPLTSAMDTPAVPVNTPLFTTLEYPFPYGLFQDGRIISLSHAALPEPVASTAIPASSPFLLERMESLALVRCAGITVTAPMGKQLPSRLGITVPCTESMEAAAFAYVTSYCELPHLTLRVVSNPVGTTHRHDWPIAKLQYTLHYTLATLVDILGEPLHFPN